MIGGLKMNKEKKSSKSKVSWVIALIVLLLVLVGGGWWLRGKGYLRGAGTEEVKKEVGAGKEVAAMSAPGGDEERLEVAEKEQKQEAGNQELSLPPEQAKKVPGMITYKKRVIREFKWNEGVDSLHKMVCDPKDGECGCLLGPDGLLVGKNGNIYIFDLDENGGGWGLKLYDQEGRLKKTAWGGTPLGIDGKGNIYTSGQVSDSELNVLEGFNPYRGFKLPSAFSPMPPPRYNYISNDGIIYFRSSRPESIFSPTRGPLPQYYYKCDPYAKDLRIDEDVAKHNPGKPPWMTIPCDEIKDEDAPAYLKMINQIETGNLIFHSELFDEKLALKGLKLLTIDFISIDNVDNIYMNYYCYKGEVEEGGRSEDYEQDNYLVVFNKDGAFRGAINICENTSSICSPDQDNYIYVDPYSGDVYQLCPDEIKPSLIVWTPKGE